MATSSLWLRVFAFPILSPSFVARVLGGAPGYICWCSVPGLNKLKGELSRTIPKSRGLGPNAWLVVSQGRPKVNSVFVI